MLYPDTTRQLETAYDHGRLPTMVYISKQNYARKSIHRPLHSHDSICELLLVYRGTGTYYVNGKSYPLSEGSVIYYNQGDLHEVISETEHEIGDYCIGITNLHLQGLPPNCLASPEEPSVRQAGGMFTLLRSMCEQMYDLEGTNTEGKLAAQLLCSAVIVLTSQLESFPLANTKEADEAHMVLRIRGYLDDHFMENISLDTAGKALGCSSTYISHIFKKATGRTPIQYIIHRRVGHAQTLLISTNYPVTQIAAIVGYDNPNYFSTIFSKVVGMSPARYREFYKEEMKGLKDQS
ncbi:AraC family transcriptional regulator [Lachnospiraceae bacterium 29-91]